MEQNNQKLKNALGLCRKAGKLVRGFDAVKDSVLAGKSWLVLTAADVSPKTARRVAQFCEELVPYEQMPLTQAELTDVSGKAVGVYAVADENLARLCEKYLNNKEEHIE